MRLEKYFLTLDQKDFAEACKSSAIFLLDWHLTFLIEHMSMAIARNLNNSLLDRRW